MADRVGANMVVIRFVYDIQQFKVGRLTIAVGVASSGEFMVCTTGEGDKMD